MGVALNYGCLQLMETASEEDEAKLIHVHNSSVPFYENPADYPLDSAWCGCQPAYLEAWEACLYEYSCSKKRLIEFGFVDSIRLEPPMVDWRDDVRKTCDG